MPVRHVLEQLQEVIPADGSSSALPLVVVGCVSLIALTASLAVCLCDDTKPDAHPNHGPKTYQPNVATAYPTGQAPQYHQGQHPPGHWPQQSGQYHQPYDGQYHGPPHGSYPGHPNAHNPQAYHQQQHVHRPSQPGYHPQGHQQYAHQQHGHQQQGHQQGRLPPGAFTVNPGPGPNHVPGAGRHPSYNGNDTPSSQGGSAYGGSARPHGAASYSHGGHAPPPHRSHMDDKESVVCQNLSVYSASNSEAVHRDQRGAGTDLYPADNSVAATVKLLHEVCDRMDGSIQPSCKLHKESIHEGIHAAVGEVTTRFGTDVTVVFFPDKMRRDKQFRMYEKAAMKDFMPVVSEERAEGVHTEGGLSVWLPAHMYVDRCTTLQDAMSQCASPRDILHELFTICQQLTRQLQMQHRRSFVLRDINTKNVVRANVGTTRSWTLLEYCSTSRIGMRTETMPAKCTPPELANERLNGQSVAVRSSYDMWQLGTFVYEVSTGQKYWPDSMTDSEVLHILASPDSKLPHEERPVPIDLAQRILMQLLTRTEESRLSADSMKRVLDKEEETGTLNSTMNAGYAKTEAPIELAT